MNIFKKIRKMLDGKPMTVEQILAMSEMDEEREAELLVRALYQREPESYIPFLEEYLKHRPTFRAAWQQLLIRSNIQESEEIHKKRFGQAEAALGIRAMDIVLGEPKFKSPKRR